MRKWGAVRRALGEGGVQTGGEGQVTSPWVGRSLGPPMYRSSRPAGWALGLKSRAASAPHP